MINNKSSVQARFVQIKSAVLDKIESGEMRPGDKVLSENKLAASFGVSRMTARRALSELVVEGILARYQKITMASISRKLTEAEALLKSLFGTRLYQPSEDGGDESLPTFTPLFLNIYIPPKLGARQQTKPAKQEDVT